MEEVVAAAEKEGGLRSSADLSFADRVFANEMDVAVTLTEASYEAMQFREALKTGFFDLQVSEGEGGRAEAIQKFNVTLALIPLCNAHVFTGVCGREVGRPPWERQKSSQASGVQEEPWSS